MPKPLFRRRGAHPLPAPGDQAWARPGHPGRVPDDPAPANGPGPAHQDGPVLVLGDGRMASLAPGTTAHVSRSQVDICFVFDTTGSMSDKIKGLVGTMSGLVGDLGSLELDWRVTTVPFGDLTVRGDRIEDGFGFVTTCEEAQAQLRSMPRFSGGGNAGESSIEAMLVGLRRAFRPRAVKVVVLLTDEPALLTDAMRPEMVAAELRRQDAVCFVASPDLTYFRAWADANGGRWLPIGPSMDTTYLRKLLRALVREVASVADDVHRLGGGSVRRYLELTAGTRPTA
ncbi:MAG: vWA domain-containing protein [Acidimicrobiales bacterium]